MSARLRPLAVRACLLALGLMSASVATAHAGTTDITWALGQSVTTYPTQFHVSTGGAAVQYRWIDTLTKDTVVSGNDCSDFTLLGSASIGGSDTSYHGLFSGFSQQCFVVRGRVASGQGATTTRTGRVSR